MIKKDEWGQIQAQHSFTMPLWDRIKWVFFPWHSFTISFWVKTSKEISNVEISTLCLNIGPTYEKNKNI